MNGVYQMYFDNQFLTPNNEPLITIHYFGTIFVNAIIAFKH